MADACILGFGITGVLAGMLGGDLEFGCGPARHRVVNKFWHSFICPPEDWDGIIDSVLATNCSYLDEDGSNCDGID